MVLLAFGFTFAGVVGGSTTRQNQQKVDEDIQRVGTLCARPDQNVFINLDSGRQSCDVKGYLGIFVLSVKFWMKSAAGSLGCPGCDQA